MISRIAGGERLGTLVPADTTVRDSRERWLLAGLHNGAGLDIDYGAVAALTKQGRSLLAAGVTNVRGEFDRGDVIQLYDPDNMPIAVGISNYSSSEAARIQGKKSSEIIEVLGYNYGSSVVHRNNLALLPAAE